MTWELYPALFIFALIWAWTPGPNNSILMASGLTHGMRKTLPMVCGVGAGVPLMIGLVGLGLGRVFEAVPQVYTIMKFAGVAYTLWLAWMIASSSPAGNGNAGDAKPLSFLQGVAFQWINPKGWIMALTALSAYTLPEAYYAGLVAVVATFVLMGFSSAAGWALFGASLRHLLTDPRWFRIVNIVLALSLVASLIPMLRH
jgi:threonine/homoserine/homoserine lactone efflux protein